MPGSETGALLVFEVGEKRVVVVAEAVTERRAVRSGAVDLHPRGSQALQLCSQESASIAAVDAFECDQVVVPPDFVTPSLKREQTRDQVSSVPVGSCVQNEIRRAQAAQMLAMPQLERTVESIVHVVA